MTLAELQSHLQSNFQPAAAGSLDAVFRLVIGEESLRFHVGHGRLDFDLSGDARVDATFRFEDADTAWALLSGRADAFDAFMHGRFSADGYLMWAFALMSMFRNTSLPPAQAD